MEHLRGLCAVLEMTIDEAAGAGSVETRTDEEQVLMNAARSMSDVDRGFLLATAVHLAQKAK